MRFKIPTQIRIPVKIPLNFKFRIPVPSRFVEPVKISHEEYLRTDFIPPKMKKFITDINASCADVPDIYRGRDKEVEQVFNSLQKTATPNVILLGDHGVGKSAIVQSIVHRTLRGECPEKLKDYHYVIWNIERTMAFVSSENPRTQELIADVFEFLTSYTNLVVVIDQIHLMETSKLLIYYFATLVKLSNVKLIGMTTEEDFYDFFLYDKKNLSLVDIIPVLEPKAKKIYPMTIEYIKCLEKIHEISISEDMVNYTISVSSAFDSELRNPGLTLNLIEKSMITAKEKGHKEVLKEDVNSHFNFNYELYNSMSPEDKKNIAYHEAGHFIVTRMSENIRNYRTKAITIVPSDYFLGVTLFELEIEKQTSCDKDYYLDVIASDLAGRVAELILQKEDNTSKLTSGASSDLKHATGTARAIITEFGMIESCGQNRTDFCNYDFMDLSLLSDERKKEIDRQTQKLIDEAFKRAEDILNDNIELLHLIAKSLLENEVLDEKDLDRLCNQGKEET